MWIADANVLVGAFREDAPDHPALRAFLDAALRSEAVAGLADAVLCGFLRVVTHPRIFTPAAPLAAALEFAGRLRAHDRAVLVAPGPRHWDIFARLCREADARGNLVPDAHLAALAIERGAELVTLDRGFARFPGLRWRDPLR